MHILLLTSVSLFRSGEAHFNRELQCRAHKEELEHEVIHGVEEESPVRRQLLHGLEVATVLLLPELEVHRGEASVNAGLKLLHDARGSCKKLISLILLTEIHSILKKLTGLINPLS